MLVLILGGDGYLGWPTATYFSARGHEVVIVDSLVRRAIDGELDVQVGDTVQPLQVLENTIQADWTSLPGRDTALNSTGQIGEDGAADGMRIGALPNVGNALNDYEAEATDSVNVPPLAITKTDLDPALPPEIGAHKPFEVRIDLPEGATNNVSLADNLATGGVSYFLSDNADFDITYEFAGIASINGQPPSEAAFNATPADGAQVVVSASGSGGSGPVVTVDGGVAPGRWYPIVRNAGSDPAAVTIRADAQQGGAALDPHPGLWEPSSRTNISQGFEFNWADDAASPHFMVWYTYDESGQPAWYFASAEREDRNIWTADLLRVTNDGAEQQLQRVGGVSLTLLASDDAMFSYTLYGESGTERMMKQSRLTCPQPDGTPASYTGHWFRGSAGLGGATVLPGNVNGHMHLYMSLTAGAPLPPRRPDDYKEHLSEVWWNLDRCLDKDSIYLAAAAGAWDAVRSGTTLIFDNHSSLSFVRGSLDEVMRELIDDGFLPSFCTACYRVGRTGEHFMEFSVPGFIKRYCTPNAMLTLAEYLEDYAPPATRAAGYKLIENQLKTYEDARFKTKLSERLMRVKEGERDLYF